MRCEFEKNRYWIGLYRSDVDFDETLGEFGRYVANGSRRLDAANLESFNEKWEVYANAWQHQQSKVDASLIAFHKLKEEINELHGQCDLHLIKYLEEKAQVLEQALKGERCQ